jgi:hypothetical protein
MRRVSQRVSIGRAERAGKPMDAWFALVRCTPRRCRHEPHCRRAVTPTSRPALDEAVAVVSEQRRAFARLSRAEKAELLRSALRLLDEVAAGWVGGRLQGQATAAGPAAGGRGVVRRPDPTARNLRLLAESLEAIAKKGQPRWAGAPAPAPTAGSRSTSSPPAAGTPTSTGA